MCITQGELYCNGVQLAYSKGLLRIPEKKPENLPCPPSLSEAGETATNI